MNADMIIATAEVFALLISAAAILFTLRGISEQLWLTTFAEYTGRFSAIMDGLPFAARDPDGTLDLDTLPTSERDQLLSTIRKYLNLCSEELYLHGRGKIDDETWAIWLQGIRETMRVQCFRRGWMLLRHEYAYYEDMVRLVDGLVSEQPDSVAPVTPTASAPSLATS